MLLQKGRFIIKDISQINLVEPSSDGIRIIIDLNYMGQFEYECNAVPISRMFI